MELAPLGPVQDIEIVDTGDFDDELLEQERELLRNILAELQKKNPNTRLFHVRATYHYIQLLRTQDIADTEIRKKLADVDWPADALDILFSRI